MTNSRAPSKSTKVNAASDRQSSVSTHWVRLDSKPGVCVACRSGDPGGIILEQERLGGRRSRFPRIIWLLRLGLAPELIPGALVKIRHNGVPLGWLARPLLRINHRLLPQVVRSMGP